MKTTRWFSGFLVLIGLLLAHAPALAAFYSGNDLVALMREMDRANAGGSEVSFVKAREYGAYIVGVFDAVEFRLDVPDNVTKGQVIAIVSKYLKNHPEEWSYSGVSLVIKALTEAFPSKKPK